MNQTKHAEFAAAPAPQTVVPIPSHLQRVVDEKRDLDDKLGKLLTFKDGPIYAGLEHAEQQRLAEQAGHMKRYSDVLGDRLEAAGLVLP